MNKDKTMGDLITANNLNELSLDKEKVTSRAEIEEEMNAEGKSLAND